MSVDILDMPTIKDREFTIPDKKQSLSGFKFHNIQKLTRKRAPRNNTNIECSHLLRTSREESTYGHQTMEYRLWVEAGKHKLPTRTKSDPQYNSNIWRNFRQSYGFHTDTKGQKVSEMIAAMYPLNLPKPSEVGQYTFAKFLKETPIIKSAKDRALAIERTDAEVKEFKTLKAKSEARFPPLDHLGNILPPEHYKKYEHNEQPVPDVTLPEAQNLESKHVDIFGRYVPTLQSRRGAYPWKLDFKQNHPNIKKVITDLEKKQREKELIRGKVHTM